MGKCINHPHRETRFICLKHTIYMCEECQQCRDPKIYCKFRSACPIWFLTQKGGNLIGTQPEGKKAAEYTVCFQPENKCVTVADGTTLLDAGAY